MEENPQIEEEFTLDNDFDYSDPDIWNKKAFFFDGDYESEDTFAKYGYNRDEVIGLLWMRQMRQIVTGCGLSLFIAIDGRHRTGKSRFAVTLASLFDRGFWPHKEDRIIRSAEQLLDQVEAIQLNGTKNPVLIVDEAGASMNNQEYFDKLNRALVKAMTVIGYLHPTIIFIAPLKEFVLKGIQKMTHVYLKLSRYSNDYTVVSPYNLEFSTFRQKMMYRHHKVNLFDTPIQVNQIRFYLPPKEINNWYDQYEKLQKPILIKDIREHSKLKTGSVKEIDPKAEELMSKVKSNIKTFESSRNKKTGKVRLDARFIKTTFGVSSELSYYVKKRIENEINLSVTPQPQENKQTEAKKEDI